jgi:hypothetical protein
MPNFYTLKSMAYQEKTTWLGLGLQNAMSQGYNHNSDRLQLMQIIANLKNIKNITSRFYGGFRGIFVHHLYEKCYECPKLSP